MMGLTDRERAVITLAADGLTREQIGSRIYISEAGVAKFLASIYAKLGAQNKSHAVAIAVRDGICIQSDSTLSL